MSMSFANSESLPQELVDINTTPLIDVMLVLLIMLIITIPVQLHAVALDLPASHAQPAVPPSVVQIDIGPAGDVHWNGEALPDQAALESRLAAAAAQPAPAELHVRPDRSVPYKAVAAVMAAVQRNGLTRVGLVGNERFQ